MHVLSHGDRINSLVPCVVLREELLELLTKEGLDLLDSLPPYDSAVDVVKEVTRLRERGYSPTLVASVLTQSRLRHRATEKFGDFAQSMLFTQAGLEQASRLAVAAHHAGRFRAAGLGRVADLGCGIGGDALAFASLGLEVLAVESDEITAALASYNLAPFPTATVRNERAEDADLSEIDGVFFDPARRTPGHSDTRRHSQSFDYTPPLSFIFTTAQTLPTGVKLGPGFDRDRIPGDAEAQWVSVDRAVVEMGLWFGVLAREGIRRSALIIDKTGTAELTAHEDSADVPTGGMGSYIYEPDGAVIRARLIGTLARELDGRMLSDGIAYITSDVLKHTPFATPFRVLENHRYDERELTNALRQRNVGSLEIKKRGVDVDPSQLRKRLSLRGDNSATIIVTRVAGEHCVLFVERITPNVDVV